MASIHKRPTKPCLLGQWGTAEAPVNAQTVVQKPQATHEVTWDRIHSGPQVSQAWIHSFPMVLRTPEPPILLHTSLLLETALEIWKCCP